MRNCKFIFCLFFFNAITTINVIAQDFSVNGLYYNVVSLEKLTCEVTHAATKYSGDIIIPENVTYNGRNFKIVGIGEEAFYHCKEMISIHLPSTLEYIGKDAFLYCDKLKEVHIGDIYKWCNISFANAWAAPLYDNHYAVAYTKGEKIESLDLKKITKISDYAFCGMRTLKDISLPRIESIGVMSFAVCIKLTSLNLPSCLQVIGKDAFCQCTGLKTVNIPPLVEKLEGDAFGGGAIYGWPHMDSVIIEESDRPINLNSSFWTNSPHEKIIIRRNFVGSSSQFKSWVIGNKVTSIPPRLFSSYTRVGGTIDFPEYEYFQPHIITDIVFEDGPDPLKIGEALYFSNYRTTRIYNQLSTGGLNFHNLYLGRPLVESDRIEEYKSKVSSSMLKPPYYYSIFYDVDIQRLTIGNYLKNEDIEYLNFPRYQGLKYLRIGKNITSVPNMTDNSNLDTLVVLNRNPPLAVGFANKTYLNCKLYVPKGCKSAYETANVWKNFWNIIELEETDETSGIEKYKADAHAENNSIYSVIGYKTNTLQRGVNVIRMNDGTVKKVIVK